MRVTNTHSQMRRRSDHLASEDYIRSMGGIKKTWRAKLLEADKKTTEKLAMPTQQLDLDFDGHRRATRD